MAKWSHLCGAQGWEAGLMMSLHARPSCQQTGTFGRSHAAPAPCRWQEPSLHPCKAGYSPGWSSPRTVTMLELSPEDELTAASQHGMAGKTGMGRARVQGKNWTTFDQVENKPLLTPLSFLSTSQKRNAAEGGFAFNNEPNTPAFSY